MNATDAEALEIAAEAIGEDHGTSAATWVDLFDAATAQRILTGINDCDPLIMDQLPTADLSGDMADGYTPADLAADLDIEDDADDELCEAYRRAFDTAMESALALRCAAYLADVDATTAPSNPPS